MVKQWVWLSNPNKIKTANNSDIEVEKIISHRKYKNKYVFFKILININNVKQKKTMKI